MTVIRLIAVGRLKSGALYEAYTDYARRLSWKLDLVELDIRDQGARQTSREHTAIMDAIAPNMPLFALDERGKAMTSPQFAQILQKSFDEHGPQAQFVIGGADGLSDDIRKMARQILSFGHMTWPHMLARVMLAEQIYRAQQIIAGHPYHRGD